MAKKIVKVNEEEIRGYMVGDIPDAVEKEDVIVVEVPALGFQFQNPNIQENHQTNLP